MSYETGRSEGKVGHDWPLYGFVLVLYIFHHSLKTSFQTCLRKQLLSYAWFKGVGGQFFIYSKWMECQVFLEAIERLRLKGT